jgi:RNA polymerase sigma factor (sigma-70 family)
VAKTAASPILDLIRRAVEDPRLRALPDQDLLQRFHAQQNQAAFHILLRRHGPMVLDVCGGVLANEADAEDAFQATFLILARKADSIRKTASLGSWLHGVAYRTALKARAQAAARQKHEARAPGRPVSKPEDLSWREVRQVVHEELSALPQRYRAPLVLCYLEGATQEAAAVQLHLAKSTLRERLERGRALLRTRLMRRGLGPAALLVASAWSAAKASARVPPSLIASTGKAATGRATGSAATSLLSARVAALTERVLKTLLPTKLRTAAAALLAGGLLVTALLGPGLCGLWQSSLDQQPAATQLLQEKPADKEAATNAPDAGQDDVTAVKPGANDPRRAHEWIVGTWRSYKVDYGDYGGWPDGPFDAEAQMELVATSPDEIDVFLLSADGKRTRAADSQPSIMDDKDLFFGPIGSCLPFRYRRPSDDVLILDLNTGGKFHVELRRYDPDGFDEAFIKSMAEAYKDKRTIEQIRKDNALIRAAGDGDREAVRKALKAGARINSYYIDGYAAFGSDGSGYTALMFAGDEGHADVVKLLIECHVDLNIRCVNPRYEGETALYRAVVRDKNAVVDLLVKAGAKGTPKEIRLGLDLRRAACRGFKLRKGEGYPNYPGNAGGDKALEIAEVLKRGADINAADPQGYTPLMYAANLGLVENVKTLLAYGANATLTTRYGVTALSIAEEESSYARADRRQVVELLKAHLAKKK